MLCRVLNTPLYVTLPLRLLIGLKTYSRCAHKMLLWIYGQWFSFSIYFFLNRVKDVNVNLVQCELTNHLVTFSRPQIPCACVFLFHFFSLFVSFFFFFGDRVEDVNLDMFQCEITEHLVTFLRSQIPYASIFFF